MNPSTLLSFIGIVASLMMVVFASVNGDFMWSAVYAALAIASWILFSKSLHQARQDEAEEPEASEEKKDGDMVL